MANSRLTQSTRPTPGTMSIGHNSSSALESSISAPGSVVGKEMQNLVSPQIAVLIPCFNEAATIAQVVRGFQKALPLAEVYVYDNKSSDRTVERAAQAGAQVRFERRQGKGH